MLDLLAVLFAAAPAGDAAEGWWEQHNATVIFTVLAGLLAIGGAVLGAVIAQKTGHQSWLKDRRLQAYADALAVSYTLWNDMARSYGSDEDDEEHSRLEFEHFNQMNAALQKVILLGPDAVAAAAERLDTAITEMYRMLGEPNSLAATKTQHGDDVHRCAEAVSWDAAEKAFISTARREIT